MSTLSGLLGAAGSLLGSSQLGSTLQTSQSTLTGLGSGLSSGILGGQQNMSAGSILAAQQQAMQNASLVPEQWNQEMMNQLYQNMSLMQLGTFRQLSTPTWHDFSVVPNDD